MLWRDDQEVIEPDREITARFVEHCGCKLLTVVQMETAIEQVMCNQQCWLSKKWTYAKYCLENDLQMVINRNVTYHSVAINLAALQHELGYNLRRAMP